MSFFSSNTDDEREQQFINFVKQIGPDAFRMALFWTHDKYLAEEIVQESFYNVWKSKIQLNDIRNFKAWFFRILWRVHIDKTRKAGHEVFIESVESIDDKNHYGILDDQLEITEAIKALPEMDQKILAMRFGSDMSIKQISSVIKSPVSTVKSRLYRALKTLRKTLEHETDTYESK